MAIQLNDNIKINAGKPSESKYFNTSGSPYTGTTQVVSQVNISERHIGLTVNVNQVEYWFKDGVTNGDLIIKQSGSVTGATNGLNINNNNIRLGGVVTGTTNITLGVGTGYTRLDFNHTDNNIAIEYNTEIDYDQPFNGAKIGVDSDGIFVAQNNYQTPQRGSVPYIRDEDGHMAFQGLAENEVYTVDASGNPTTIELSNLDPWLTGGTFVSQGNISIQGGDGLEYSFEHNVDSFNVQGITNVSLQSGGILSLQANEASIFVDERVIINTSLYNAGIIVGSVDGDSIGIQLQLGDNVTAPETGALFYQNEFDVLDSINPTVDGHVLTLVGGLPTWSAISGSSSVTITGATNGLSIQSGNVVLGGTLTGYTTIEGADGFALLAGDIDNGAFNEISTTISGDLSYGYLITKNNSTSGNTAESSVQTVANLSGSTLLLAATSASENVSILLTSDYDEGSILVGVLDNNLGFKGIQYKDDYSSDFGSRSIPDVAWVLSQVGGGGTVTGATNGLNIDNNNVRLGGNLSGYTQLQLDGDYTTFQLYSPMGVTGVTKFGTYFSDGFQSSTGIQQANDNIVISVNSNTISASIKFDGVSGITINGGAMRYISDYSSGYTALSIPSVGWVTGLTSGGSVNVGNGLSKSGSTIVLGGSLTGNTRILTNENEFVVGDPFGTGNYLGLNFLGYGFITENQTNPQGITIGNYSGITSINHNDPNEILDISSTSLLRIHTSDNGLTPVRGIEISAADKGFLYLESIDGVEKTYLRISSTGDTIFHDDRNVGLKYDGDYSGNYDSRSIPDVEWVTNFVTDGLTANNGLVKVGTTISLGGELTGDTSIRGAGSYSLNFGGDGSDVTTNRINQFNINARNTVLRSASDTFATSLIELGTGGDDTSITLSASGIGFASLLIQQQSGIASFLVTGSGTFKGFEYADDYSANFGPRSIPDVAWITGRTVTVGNGLTTSGSTVILGGNLVTVTELSIGFGSAFGIVSDNVTPIDIDPNQAQFYTNFYTPTASLQSSITQSLNSINFSSINNTGGTSSNLSISNSGEASFNGSKSLSLDSSTGLVTINSLSGVTITGAQAKYDNDYSSTYTDRSIIDKAYALGLVETEISLSSSSGEIAPSKINYLGLYDTSASALTVDLPTTPANKSTVKIKDRTGNANSNNLTINGNGRTIDGSSTALINTNYGCIEFIYFDVTDEWFIIGMVI